MILRRGAFYDLSCCCYALMLGALAIILLGTLIAAIVLISI